MSLENRKRDAVKVVVSIIEGDGDAPLWQSSSVETVDGFVEGKNRALHFAKDSQALVEKPGRYVEATVPEMFVLVCDAVIAEDQEPVATPAAVGDRMVAAGALGLFRPSVTTSDAV